MTFRSRPDDENKCCRSRNNRHSGDGSHVSVGYCRITYFLTWKWYFYRRIRKNRNICGLVYEISLLHVFQYYLQHYVTKCMYMHNRDCMPPFICKKDFLASLLKNESLLKNSFQFCHNSWQMTAISTEDVFHCCVRVSFIEHSIGTMNRIKTLEDRNHEKQNKITKRVAVLINKVNWFGNPYSRNRMIVLSTYCTNCWSEENTQVLFQPFRLRSLKSISGI